MKDKKHFSTAKTGKKIQIEKYSMHKGTGRNTKEFNVLQIAHYLHHLITWTMTHLQPSGTCFRSISSPLGPSSPDTVLSHMLLGLWGRTKTKLINIDLVLEAHIS